jgi:hypothetical protein
VREQNRTSHFPLNGDGEMSAKCVDGSAARLVTSADPSDFAAL